MPSMSDAASTEPSDQPEQDAAEFQRQDARAGKQLRNWLISLGILGAIAVGLLLAVPGLHKVGTAIQEMPIGWVLAAIVMELLSCAGYVIVFQHVFREVPARFGTKVALSELGFGAAVSLFGIGNVALGAWLLIERGIPMRSVAKRSAVMLLMLGAADLITLALAGLGLWSGLLPGPHDPLLSLLPGGIAAAIFLVLLPAPELADRLLAGREEKRWVTWSQVAADTLREARQTLFRPDWRLLGLFVYIWADVAVLGFCCRALGHPVPLSALVLVYQIGYLSSALPVPGGIGVLDGSFIGLFILYGVDATVAASATLVYHAIALWVPAALGTLAFLSIRRSRQ